MIKETVKIKLTEDYKQSALSLIDNTINKVANANNKKLNDAEKRKIKNLTLDQINVNVTSKVNAKTLWGFNIEQSLPVIVERDEKTARLGNLVEDEKNNGLYQMKPNLTWTFSRKNKEGLSRQEFEKTVLDMFFDDVETAAFYGALSFVGDVNEY